MRFLSVLLVVLSVFFSLTFDDRVVRTIGIFSCIILAFSWLYLRLAGRSLQVKRIEPLQRCFREGSLDLYIEFANKGILPVSNFRYSDPTGNMFPVDVPRGNISLEGGRRIRLKHRVEARQRGRFQVGPVTVRGRDPVGLFDFVRKYDQIGECIVYPRVYPLDFCIEGGLPAGYLRTENPLYEDVSRYRSIREYVPGDSMAHISWKHSARMGKLYTREFLPTYNYNVLFVANLCAGDYPLQQRYAWIERVIELTASFVFHVIGQKQKIGLACAVQNRKDGNSGIFPIQGGEAHGMQILEYLACLQAGPNADFLETLRAGRPESSWNTRVVYAGPLLEAEKMKTFSELWPRTCKIEYLLAAVSRQTVPESDKYRTFHIIKEFGDISIDQH